MFHFYPCANAESNKSEFDGFESNNSFPQNEENEDTLSYQISAESASTSGLINIKSQEIQIISSGQIEKSFCDSTGEILEKLGNINVKQYGALGSASTLYLRNFSGSSIAVLVDGVQVNSSQTGEFDINRINPGNIDCIEIVRGASDAKYSVSGAVGGIVNIVTKKDGKKKISANVFNKSYIGGSLLDTQGVSAEMSGKSSTAGWNFSGSFINAKNNYLYHNQLNKTVEKTNSQAKAASLSGSLYFNMQDDKQLSVADCFYYGSEFCPGNRFSAITGEQEDIFNTASACFTVPWAFDGVCDIETRASYKYDRTFYDDNIASSLSAKSLHRLHTAAVSSIWEFFPSNFCNLIASVDSSLDILDSTDCQLPEIDSSIFNNPFRFVNGLSLESDFLIGERIKIYPACKVLINPYAVQKFVPVPKIGFSFDFLADNSKNTVFKSILLNANIYRMFVFPTLNQLYWKDTGYAVGNPDLDNEDGWGADTEISIDINHLSFGMGLFTALYKNKIQWGTAGNGKLHSINAGEAAYFGGNISVDIEILKNLTLKARYDLCLSYLLSGNLTISDNKRIMYTPVHLFSCSAEYALGIALFSCSWRYTGSRYVSNMNINYLQPYSLFDASVSIKIAECFTIYINADNILNTEYYEVEDYPMPGISITAGLRYEL